MINLFGIVTNKQNASKCNMTTIIIYMTTGFLKVLLAMINEIVKMAISITKLHSIYSYVIFIYSNVQERESKATSCQENLTLLPFLK